MLHDVNTKSTNQRGTTVSCLDFFVSFRQSCLELYVMERLDVLLQELQSSEMALAASFMI